MLKTKSRPTRPKVRFQVPSLYTLRYKTRTGKIISKDLPRPRTKTNHENPKYVNKSPLWIAAITNNLDLVRTLLQNGENISPPNYKENPLCISTQFLGCKIDLCRSQWLETIHTKRLLTNKETQTQRLIIIELIQAGLPIQQIFGIRDKENNAYNLDPVLWSIKNADAELTQLLIAAGGKIDPRHPWIKTENLPSQWKENTKIIQILTSEANTPPPLLQITNTYLRNLIRINTKRDIRLIIRALDIPRHLQNNLCLFSPSEIARSACLTNPQPHGITIKQAPPVIYHKIAQPFTRTPIFPIHPINIYI